jgi:hypothetical protein
MDLVLFLYTVVLISGLGFCVFFLIRNSEKLQENGLTYISVIMAQIIGISLAIGGLVVFFEDNNILLTITCLAVIIELALSLLFTLLIPWAKAVFD